MQNPFARPLGSNVICLIRDTERQPDIRGKLTLERLGLAIVLMLVVV